jgi:hypothetical protein
MKPLDAHPSTLWRVSAFEQHRQANGESALAGLGMGTTMSSTLMAELALVERHRQGRDPLVVLAACLRQREQALLLVRHQGLVWPATVFPREGLYHCPRPLHEVLAEGSPDLALLSVESAGLRPPGHAATERVGYSGHYRTLTHLVWALALQVPHARLFDEIAGHAAYRVTPDHALGPVHLGGALAPAYERLRTEIVALRDMSRWPGMTLDRAVRLLNALYVQGGLIVLRAHHAARQAPGDGGITGWMRRRSR